MAPTDFLLGGQQQIQGQFSGLNDCSAEMANKFSMKTYQISYKGLF
jgi:hypothetical protein